ncbi:MAG: thiol:disulfide interchange protein DsbA/DsbL [Pseudomonadota bacterium]
MKRLLLAFGLSAALTGCAQKVVPPVETPAAAPSSTPAPAPTAQIEPQQDPAPAAAEPANTTPASSTAPGKPIPSKWIADRHYQLILPAQGTDAGPGQVEIIEFMWLGCPHCYELNPYIEAWKKKLPPYVKFRQEHIVWDAGKTAHARLFYTLEVLGRSDELIPKAFDEIHRKNNLLAGNSEAATEEIQETFAAANGINPADYKREATGFAVNTHLQRANQLMRQYRIDSVPNFIVNGKYRTDVGMAGAPAQLIELLNDLAASEKGR